MLKINPAPTFTVPVELTVPGQEKGEIIRVTFRHKTAEGLSAWIKDNWEKPSRDGLLDVIEGWTGVVDEKGDEVPFDAESLDHLLHGYAPATGELVRAYVKALTESRAKN